MSRKSFLMAVGIVLALVGGAGASLVLLVRHRPASYVRACIPPGPERKELSEEVKSQFSALFNGLQTGSEHEWDIHLTDDQINSYFVEDFITSNLDKHSLPEGISEPRVLFEPGKVRLAFRYGSGLWSTIISVSFNVWLPDKEPNAVALQLVSLQAGSLPIGTQTVLDSLSELAENNNIQIDWYRHEGHPTALLRFQSSQNDSAVQLQEVQIGQGSITIRGKPNDSGPTRAASLPQPTNTQ